MKFNVKMYKNPILVYKCIINSKPTWICYQKLSNIAIM